MTPGISTKAQVNYSQRRDAYRSSSRSLANYRLCNNGIIEPVNSRILHHRFDRKLEKSLEQTDNFSLSCGEL